MVKPKASLVKWDEKFAAYARKAQESVKNIGGGGRSVSFRAGVIEVAGATVPGNKLECIIIGAVAFNGWYKDAYDSSNPQPPDCYAFGVLGKEENMAPHEKAEEPQNADCASCEKNQYGSAETRRGKACGNNIRMGLLLAKDCEDGTSTKAAEMATAKVSPTNLKAYRGYVDSVADEHGRPPWAVITQIQSLADSKTQIRLEFSMLDLITDAEIIEALEARANSSVEPLIVPFPPRAEKPTPRAAPPRNAKFRGPVTRGPK